MGESIEVPFFDSQCIYRSTGLIGRKVTTTGIDKAPDTM
jgi:hypothetical protein